MLIYANDHGSISGREVGQRVILPASFAHSPRRCLQEFHDCVAILDCLGKHDLFITFTANLEWPEIKQAMHVTMMYITIQILYVVYSSKNWIV